MPKMSNLPHFNEPPWPSPPYYARPLFLRDCSFYEQITYSEVPFYAHRRACLPTPNIFSHTTNPSFVVPLWSPLVFNQHQRESNCSRWIDTTVGPATFAEVNASRTDVLGMSNTIQSSSDTKDMFKSHQQSSSSSEQITLNKTMVNLTASKDPSDPRALKQKGSTVERNEHKSTVYLNAAHKLEHSGKNEVNNISSEHQAGKHSISSQSGYLSTSELNLTNLSLSVDKELKSQCKKEQKISIPPEGATERDNNVLNNEDLLHFDDNQTDYQCSDLDDDSQLEYHSAEEQACNCHSSSDTSETFNNKKLVSEGGLTSGQTVFHKMEDEYSNTSCSISNFCSSSERPEFSQTFQTCNCTADHCLNCDGQEGDETLDRFYSTEDLFSAEVNRKEKKPKSFLTSKNEVDEKVKAISLIDTTQTCKLCINRGLFKKTDNSNTSVSQEIGNPELAHQERILMSPAHTSGGPSDISDSCPHEQSVSLNTHDTCTCKLDRRVKDFSNSELSSIMGVRKTANKNQSTVSQAVDATSDFRACFTTSRATNVKASVVTRAQNTVITMMNKYRPDEWLSDSHRSVACNTDWSCMSANLEAADSQIAISDIFENSFISDTTKHGWKPKTEDPLEYKNSTSKELNEIPNRLMHLSQEISDHLPNCCKEIWQRAIKTEIQLLKIRYQMYHQHCWQTYQPVIREKEHVNSSAHETGKSVSQVSLLENTEASSHLVTHQMSEKLCPSNKNVEEGNNERVENDISEATENWFDATENLTANDSSLSLKETQTINDRRKESKNLIYVHVGNLDPLVSDVDLWLNFQKYNVSEIKICGCSERYRYASLSFKSACDAHLAVKEMNEKPIKGKAVRVRLTKTVREKEVTNHQSSVKQERENQRPHSRSRKNIVSAAPRVIAGGPISSKKSDASENSLKSSLPTLSNTPAPISVSSNVPLCAPAPSKDPDFKHSKPSSRNSCFEIDEEDVAESLLPLGSVECALSPNTLSLRSFRKVVKKLEKLHPKASRENILNALVETKESKGTLRGLPLRTIVQMTSALVNKKFTSKFEEINTQSKK